MRSESCFDPARHWAFISSSVKNPGSPDFLGVSADLQVVAFARKWRLSA
jgi:hypothetical protein